MTADRDEIRVAVVLHEFPGITQTFVLNQLVSLLQHGCILHIYATRVLPFPKTHADVARYRLTEIARQPLSMPKNYALRILKAAWQIIVKRGWTKPKVLLRALDVRTFGEAASSLELLYLAIPIIGDGDHDIVHVQFGDLAGKALLLRRVGALTGRLVTSFRGFDASRHLARNPHAYTELFEQGHLFLPVSRYFSRRLVDHGCPKEKIRVLHSGIELSKFPERKARPIGDPVQLLTVGRLIEKKGMAYGIRAVANLVQRGHRVNYAIVGDGALRPELEALVDSLRLTTVVELLPWQEHADVIRMMQHAHILITPSVTAEDGDQEGIPNVLKEAMALGLPVIATRHSGIGELIEDGVSGLLAPERDEIALAEGIRRLIDDPELYRVISRSSRRTIEMEFDCTTLNESLYELYLQQYRLNRTGDGESLSAGNTEWKVGPAE